MYMYLFLRDKKNTSNSIQRSNNGIRWGHGAWERERDVRTKKGTKIGTLSGHGDEWTGKLRPQTFIGRFVKKKKKEGGHVSWWLRASGFRVGEYRYGPSGLSYPKEKKKKEKKLLVASSLEKKKTRQEIWEEKFFWRSCDSIVSQRDGGDHSVRKDLGQEFIYFECMSRWRRYGLDNGKGKHREIYSWDIGQQGNCDVLTGEWFRTGNPVSSATARLILQSV